MKVFIVVLVCLASLVYSQASGQSGPCSAIALPTPFTEPVSVFGSTTHASAQNSGSCASISNSGTVWYSLDAEPGSILNVTTCSVSTNFDTVVSVYAGSCDQLTCTVYNDDASCALNSGASTIQWTSSGEIYYVGISGYSSSTGNFEATFAQVSGGSSSSCANAVRIPGPYTVPVTVFGNNGASTGLSPSQCGLSSSSKIDWYEITPLIGSQVEITTCNTATTFDTFISVFSGSCSALVCEVYNDDNCTTAIGVASYVSFVASLPSYYVAIAGFSTQSGSYEVRIVEHQGTSQPGSTCVSAFPVPVAHGTTIDLFGSTIGYPVSHGVGSCSFSSAAAWYILTMNGYTGTVTATTCNPGTTFDTYLAVFSGTCQNLGCVTSNDDVSCSTAGFASTVTFSASTSLQTAFVAVAGFGSQTGSYHVTFNFS